MCQKVKTTVKKIGKTAIIALAAIFIAGAANAQSKQKVAVYVTGESSNAYKKVIGAKMVSAITQEENYAAVERTAEFITELNKEHDYQRSGAVSDNQIAKLGEQFGVRFVVVVDVSELFGSAFIAARMINVQTGQITATADKDKEINGMTDLTELSESVAKALFGKDKKTSTLPIKSDNYVVLEDYGLMVMKKDLGTGNWSSAKSICEQSRSGGFSDWRLPSQVELSILYNERNTIGGFYISDDNPWYWSSNGGGNYNNHWLQNFNTGKQFINTGDDSNYNHRCRCVRNY